jgi:hypothetical protein
VVGTMVVAEIRKNGLCVSPLPLLKPPFILASLEQITPFQREFFTQLFRGEGVIVNEPNLCEFVARTV